MIIKNVKGSYNFLPKEQRLRNYINDTLRGIFEQYGYNPIETPILSYYDILSDKYDEGNDLLNEIYKLSDQGKRKLGLRYDLTVPFAKFIALNKNNITFPFKKYEIAKSFRDGPVKPGRDREFIQCDVDVVGLSGQMIEAEMMTLFNKAFNKLGIDIVIKYNSRNLMTGIILECGVNEESVSSVTTVIDKLEKITESDFRDSLEQLGLSDIQVEDLKSNFKLSLQQLNTKFKNTTNKKIISGLEELNYLEKYLVELDLNKICIFAPSLARGQNYYTGNVFEVFDKQKRVTSSIGAGGRYDKMITDFIGDGNAYPAVGISFGLSSIYEILKNTKANDISNTDIYIIPMNSEIQSLKLANDLREIGLNVDIEMQKRKLKKSLDYANKEKIPYVIILGEDEITAQKFKLKNMSNRNETVIDFSNLDKLAKIVL